MSIIYQYKKNVRKGGELQTNFYKNENDVFVLAGKSEKRKVLSTWETATMEVENKNFLPNLPTACHPKGILETIHSTCPN